MVSTIRIHYTNGDSKQRYANVVVNGKGYVVAFNPTAGGDTAPGTSTLSVPLLSSGNVVKFEGYNGGWGEFVLGGNGFGEGGANGVK